MQSKKRPEKILPVPELKSQVTEILVTNGRSFQPFIRTFHYSGENITKSNLGTLIGVFEIDETIEDCAYIVNFLASVAKKEYFSNPRRGAIESFEVALHKINLALSELVKHGNVAWLGKLHGTIAVLEKNNIHFSVTGKGNILLIRNEVVSDIGAGLSSEESAIHPIKTFIEVSSGRLNLDDRIILASPELLALFSLEELAKNARRMDNEQFLQFLKTALVNELDMTGALLIDVVEEVIAEVPKNVSKNSEEKSLERIANIFSQSAFIPKKPSESPAIEEALVQSESAPPLDEEYVDTKTGHIYVQGATPQESSSHAGLERFFLGLEEITDATRTRILSQGKWFRKGRKQFSLGITFLGDSLKSAKKRIVRTLKRKWRTLVAPRTQKNISAEPTPPQISFPAIKQTDSLPSQPHLNTSQNTQNKEFTHSNKKSEGTALPTFIQEKLRNFYLKKQPEPLLSKPQETQTASPEILTNNKASFSVRFENWTILMRTFLRALLKAIARALNALSSLSFEYLTPLTRRTLLSLQQLSPSQRHLALGGCITLLAVSVGWYLWPHDTPTTNIATEPNQPSALIATPQENSTPSGAITILANTTRSITGSVVLNDATYLVTKNEIISINDNKSYPLPSGNSARFATAMDDLRLIFVFTDGGKLFAFSPISKTFAENTLSLPEGTTVAGIDTYLTYLYILDTRGDQVYRYPRADGGFGSSTAWLRESFPLEESAHLAVNETLFIAPSQNSIRGFFRGRESVSFQSPAELEITDLYTHPGLQNVYALDAPHHRVLVWNQDGKLLQELSHDQFGEGQSLSVNEKSSEIFISTENTLLSYKLK